VGGRDSRKKNERKRKKMIEQHNLRLYKRVELQVTREMLERQQKMTINRTNATINKSTRRIKRKDKTRQKKDKRLY